MGYQLSSLGNLPVDDTVNFYIFIVNGDWNGGDYEILENNFSNIAERIGPNAVIAKGFDSKAWTGDVAKAYLGKNARELFGLLPALLLTDSHPDNLNDDSFRLLIPLGDAKERFGNFDTFFAALSDFAVSRDSAFLEKFEDESDLIEAGNSIVDLKPNFFGVGINLNAVIERYRNG